MSTLQDKLNAPFVDLLPATAKPAAEAPKLTREAFLALKHSELLELAVNDLRNVTKLRDPQGRQYRFDLSTFYEEASGKRCYVCVAGACAVRSLGIRSEDAYNRLMFGDPAVDAQLDTISHYATGYVKYVSGLPLADFNAITEIRSHHGYPHGREDVIAYLTDVIAYLKAQGR
jgi:hypothetical protein